MKKIILSVMCAVSILSLKAQSDENRCYVYGIDFTNAKVYAADETVEQLAKAFEAINMLIITEPEKYDFSKTVNKRVTVILEPMLKRLSNCSYDDLKTINLQYDEIDCASIVKEYSLPQTDGTGIVMIAKLLNKPANNAAFDLVLFDIASREIICKKSVTGKASGFGLRNYWANSVYRILTRTKLY